MDKEATNVTVEMKINGELHPDADVQKLYEEFGRIISRRLRRPDPVPATPPPPTQKPASPVVIIVLPAG